MKKKIIGVRAVLVLALALAFSACTSPTAGPTTPPEATREAAPQTRALRFYEFYSPL